TTTTTIIINRSLGLIPTINTTPSPQTTPASTLSDQPASPGLNPTIIVTLLILIGIGAIIGMLFCRKRQRDQRAIESDTTTTITDRYFCGWRQNREENVQYEMTSSSTPFGLKPIEISISPPYNAHRGGEMTSLMPITYTVEHSKLQHIPPHHYHQPKNDIKLAQPISYDDATIQEKNYNDISVFSQRNVSRKEKRALEQTYAPSLPPMRNQTLVGRVGMSDVAKWSVAEVSEVGRFEENDMDGYKFLLISEESLVGMGIFNASMRAILLFAVNRLRMGGMGSASTGTLGRSHDGDQPPPEYS
ncbi:hypothetical protein BC829DRAFT_384470, partial [Chytridium lagenaria]